MFKYLSHIIPSIIYTILNTTVSIFMVLVKVVTLSTNQHSSSILATLSTIELDAHLNESLSIYKVGAL